MDSIFTVFIHCYYKITAILLYQNDGYSLAEKEGFEPSNGFTRYTISSRAPSTKLGDFSRTDKLQLDAKIILPQIGKAVKGCFGKSAGKYEKNLCGRGWKAGARLLLFPIGIIIQGMERKCGNGAEHLF